MIDHVGVSATCCMTGHQGRMVHPLACVQRLGAWCGTGQLHRAYRDAV